MCAGFAAALESLGNVLLRTVRRLLWPCSYNNAIVRRICVYRIGNIGDVICALPAIKAIRSAYPDAHLTLLTSPGAPGSLGAVHLLTHAPWLDQIMEYSNSDITGYSGRKALLLKLRENKFDLWISLPSTLDCFWRQILVMCFARLCGVHQGIGWQLGMIRWFKRAQSEYRTFPNEVERLCGLVRSNGIPVQEIEYGLPIESCHRAMAGQAIEESGLLGFPLVAIGPGAKRPTNNWPSDRFVEIAPRLVWLGYGVVIVAGEAERDTCGKIEKAIGTNVANMAGRCSLLESCALLERCEFLVCVDSGVQHMAAAVGTPCVSIFSARDFPGMWWPQGEHNVILRHRVECDTCLLEYCPKENFCMNAISTEDVWVAINCIKDQIEERGVPNFGHQSYEVEST